MGRGSHCNNHASAERRKQRFCSPCARRPSYRLVPSRLVFVTARGGRLATTGKTREGNGGGRQRVVKDRQDERKRSGKRMETNNPAWGRFCFWW